MLTRRRPNRPRALSATLVAGFAGLPLAVTFAAAVEPGQAAQAVPKDQPAPAAPFAVLRGRVTTKTGDPLPGVRVLVAIPAADMRFVDPGTDHMRLEAKSDADGEYRLELPGIAGRTKVSIDAMMPGFRRLVGTLMAGGDPKDLEIDPGAAVEANLSLEPARYFAGIVVDEQGRPIPGVKVSANLVIGRGSGGIERTATKPDGSFEIFNYPADLAIFAGRAGKGYVGFSHPDYVEARVDDVYAIEPGMGAIRVVLPTGRKVAGTVLDAAGKPVPNAFVQVVMEAKGDYKATQAGADGKFTLRGLVGGPTILGARAFEIKQKLRLPIDLDADRLGLEVRLQPIILPADLKKHEVLGMRLADATADLKSAYDLRQSPGALILDPGEDTDRLKIGRLAEGYLFWMVGDKRIGTVREFVDGILQETAGRDAQEYSVRVVYNFQTPEAVGSNTQYLKLTKDDIQQLRALADRLKADPR